MLKKRPSRRLLGERGAIRACCLFLSCLGLLAPSIPAALAQKAEKVTSIRKVITQVEADYPPDLKRALIGGVVRLDVVVSARGTVDYIQVAGGNPILAESAAKAVKQWKYAPAATTTNIRVNVHFDPTH